ncbi:muramidase [Sphingomonas sp. Leaf67]|uniref:muramidase n=1 Tax=Sphingomonas sp. Leaf67 TaxID=1736230 RepID=UPI0009E8F528|nr:muramidase [Sphingomonas sp. Leaf67]
MLPAALTAKAIQLCAAQFAAMGPAPAQSFPIVVLSGAALVRQPQDLADAETTVRELLAIDADFTAGPLRINGRDFTMYGITPSSVFDPCSVVNLNGGTGLAPAMESITLSSVSALLRRSFGARITDTVRPANANYGARYSWHKAGQAIDFVPRGGVHAVDRLQIRALMARHGIRILELLGPGDRGHSHHWHIAFARPGQIIDRTRPVEGGENWIVNVASVDGPADTNEPDAHDTPSLAATVAAKPPPEWDVFATAAWRASKGGG